MSSDLVRGGVVLGVVPGWAACGWALVRLEPAGDRVLQAGVIRTRDSRGQMQLTTSPDPGEVRRGRLLVGQIRVVAFREPLVAVVRRGVDVADPLDQRAYGALDAIADELEVPTFELPGLHDPRGVVSQACDVTAIDAMLDEDEVAARQHRRAFEAVALVIEAAKREPLLRDARGLARRRPAIAKT